MFEAVTQFFDTSWHLSKATKQWTYGSNKYVDGNDGFIIGLHCIATNLNFPSKIAIRRRIVGRGSSSSGDVLFYTQFAPLISNLCPLWTAEERPHMASRMDSARDFAKLCKSKRFWTFSIDFVIWLVWRNMRIYFFSRIYPGSQIW